MANARERRIPYLTYPVCAGITVTFSRGVSPHSVASQKAGTPSLMNLSEESIAYSHEKCKRKLQSIALWPPQDQPDQHPAAKKRLTDGSISLNFCHMPAMGQCNALRLQDLITV